jgi:DNA-directed RNA polymerase specialized sigma24 family protein
VLGSAVCDCGELSSGLRELCLLPEADRRFAVRVALAEHRGHPGSALGSDAVVELAVDAAQDALLQHDGREHGRRAFLARAIKWRLADAYRRAGRVQPVAEPPDRVAHDFVAETIDRVLARSLIAGLTERQKAVVFALYFVGLDVDDTAERLGLRRTAVVSLRHRALERMRRQARPGPSGGPPVWSVKRATRAL